MPNWDTARIILQDIADGIDYYSLPPSWSNLNNLIFFSKTKSLFDYQEDALKNAIKILYLYFHNASDYQEDEDVKINEKRKEVLFNEYERRGLRSDQLIISASRQRTIYKILSEYFKSENKSIPYKNFINRMSFWMATGSGKTLVIVKLIEILRNLIKRKEIPSCDILILTCREDLEKKMREYVNEYNESNSLYIRLWSLKEFNKVKYGGVLPKGENSVDVFIYRSDLISDEEKEKIIDFRNYENNGRWYILLDEAHKGDKDESKRQAFYSIMSRNGFLFNFSATFTDPRDIYTTVYNINLAEYVGKGYGKNIYVSEQEFEAFRDKDDFSNFEKQKIVLKTLIMLAYLKKAFKNIKNITNYNLYHIPLMLSLTHTVNPKDPSREPDLVMFFKEIEKIAEGKLEIMILEKAKKELANEFEKNNPYVFGNEILNIESDKLAEITYDDIIKEVFNSSAPGKIEVLIRPSNKQELAFKLKTSDKPFASVKIGDISSWLKETLSGYEIIERWEDESFFERINKDDSDINILMGSRSFYEGWDSNRPNIITFINIGMGTEAKKFIIQAIGRGARIEPIKNRRQRINYLAISGEERAKEIINKIDSKKYNLLETLFIFGTKKDNIKEIITTMKEEKVRAGEMITLDKNPKADGAVLLIPCYKERGKTPVSEIPKFNVNHESITLLRSYIKWIEDDRILLNLYFLEPTLNVEDLIGFKTFIENDDHFKFNNSSILIPPTVLLPQLITHVNIQIKDLERFKKLEEEIIHFKKIEIYLDEDNIAKFKEKIVRVKNYPKFEIENKKLSELYGRISVDEFIKRATEIKERYPEKETYSLEGKDVGIYYVAEHYYIPLLSTKEKVKWITHIICTESEHNFIQELINYMKQEKNLFKKFDWWMFSKIDGNLDKVYIPYYKASSNSLCNFKPDFIFWLCKGKDYYILFVDPKGISHTEFGYKVEGYEKIFRENGQPKTFKEHGYNIKVFLSLYTEDKNLLPERMYKEYWYDNIDKLIGQICL